ncbi:class I SAM-dependent methyltransferase, partial [Patescibacteria group bacterium]|nr:class I SAM-dependent methyltransferase [Patescibacteria group bacterium]
MSDWQPMYEKLEECPYCCGRDIVFLYSAPDRYSGKAGEFHLSKCVSCGLVFQNPRIPEREIQHFYPDDLGYYRVIPEGESLSGKRRILRFLRNAVLVNHFSYDLTHKSVFWKIVTWPLKRYFHINGYPEYQSGGKVLEIGCANGRFLAQLKRLGWTVEGLEMNEKAADYAKTVRHIDVKSGKFGEVTLTNGPYDAVVMNMVLEHLYSPFETL